MIDFVPSVSVPLALGKLSECYLYLGDVVTAKSMGEEALAIMTSSQHRNHPHVGVCE